ncbi:HdeA family protein [Bradyrhizobium yuanmingense]|uniref:HdeA family protein n=1 Tax=Bradyrhizobium yuanmingense TaxID=108015 RepID=UPI0023B8D15B|nr:HdeA family protein [Bradyrhizobium yuanmingense]MDF0583706.1 HdeA family protein [Bradyrhizobium yuanmingense]
MEILIKTSLSILFAAALSLASMLAHAVKWDLSTMTCKQFLESGEDNMGVVLTWMDGWYKGDEDNAIIDTDVFIENAKKFGSHCGQNPTVSVVTAADEILGK